MKKILFTIAQLLLFCSFSYAQFVVDGIVEKTAKVGDSVTFNWVAQDSPSLLYFRIRRAQTSSGAYNVWVKIDKTLRQYTFIITDSKSYNYFITAWYSSVDSNGNPIVVESVGSNHVRINVSP